VRVIVEKPIFISFRGMVNLLTIKENQSLTQLVERDGVLFNKICLALFASRQP